MSLLCNVHHGPSKWKSNILIFPRPACVDGCRSLPQFGSRRIHTHIRRAGAYLIWFHWGVFENLYNGLSGVDFELPYVILHDCLWPGVLVCSLGGFYVAFGQPLLVLGAAFVILLFYISSILRIVLLWIS